MFLFRRRKNRLFFGNATGKSQRLCEPNPPLKIEHQSVVSNLWKQPGSVKHFFSR